MTFLAFPLKIRKRLFTPKCSYLSVILLVSLFGLVCSQSRKNRNSCRRLVQSVNDEDQSYALIHLNGLMHNETYKLEISLLVSGLTRDEMAPTSKYISLIDGEFGTLRNIQRNQPVILKLVNPVDKQLPVVTQILINDRSLCVENISKPVNFTRLNLIHTLESFNLMNNIQSSTPNKVDPSSSTARPKSSSTQENDVASISKVLPTSTEISTIATPADPPITEPQATDALTNETQSISITTLNDICGTTALITRPLVVRGETIERGSWPWLVALYLNGAKGLSFQCCGNLVTSKAVITAAHCLKLYGVEYLPKHIVIIAGRHNLLDWSERTSVTIYTEKILVHPDYNQSLYSFDGDVAMVIIKDKITFNDYIRPICIWHEDSDVRLIEGQDGVVVGWGRDEYREVSPEPKKVVITVVSGETCLRSNDRFSQLTSNRTFCAGKQNGEGPCTGDSGAGMMIQRSGRWTMRGMVSAGLGEANSGNCDLKQYVVYADIAKFTSWIYSNIEY